MVSTYITVLGTIIVALVAIFGSAASVYLTKQKEREAAWRAKKLDYYEEFFRAASGIVGQATDESRNRFASAVNNLHLIGSDAVIKALHTYVDLIAVDRRTNFDQSKHDESWSRLVWEIRADLGDAPCSDVGGFRARLWYSGAQKDKQG